MRRAILIVALLACGCDGRRPPTPPTVVAAAPPPGRFALWVRSTHYCAGETRSDPDTDAGRSSTGVRLRPATATSAGVCAVDPAVIPYGSRVTVTTDAGDRTYVAADTGSAVRRRTASGGTVPVVDFYSPAQVGGEYVTLTVVPYARAMPFTRLTAAEKAAALRLDVTRP